MFKYTFKLSFILLFAAISSCTKAPEYPKEPVIKFEKIEKFVIFNESSQSKQDSIVVTLSFTDGDGDLGLDADDVLHPPYQGQYNYILDIFRKVGTNNFAFMDLAKLGYGNFAPLVDKKYRGPIDGILRRTITIDHVSNPEIPNNTVVRFEVQILDRALNKSNKITTPEVKLKEI